MSVERMPSVRCQVGRIEVVKDEIQGSDDESKIEKILQGCTERQSMNGLTMAHIDVVC